MADIQKDNPSQDSRISPEKLPPSIPPDGCSSPASNSKIFLPSRRKQTLPVHHKLSPFQANVGNNALSAAYTESLLLRDFNANFTHDSPDTHQVEVQKKTVKTFQEYPKSQARSEPSTACNLPSCNAGENIQTVTECSNVNTEHLTNIADHKAHSNKSTEASVFKPESCTITNPISVCSKLNIDQISTSDNSDAVTEKDINVSEISNSAEPIEWYTFTVTDRTISDKTVEKPRPALKDATTVTSVKTKSDNRKRKSKNKLKRKDKKSKERESRRSEKKRKKHTLACNNTNISDSRHHTEEAELEKTVNVYQKDTVEKNTHEGTSAPANTPTTSPPNSPGKRLSSKTHKNNPKALSHSDIRLRTGGAPNITEQVESTQRTTSNTRSIDEVGDFNDTLTYQTKRLRKPSVKYSGDQFVYERWPRQVPGSQVSSKFLEKRVERIANQKVKETILKLNKNLKESISRVKSIKSMKDRSVDIKKPKSEKPTDGVEGSTDKVRICPDARPETNTRENSPTKADVAHVIKPIEEVLQTAKSKRSPRSATKLSCPSCGYTTRNKSHLKVHLRQHTGVKPFECEKCSKKFFTKSGLVVHTRIHDGVKPYSCTECQRQFRTSSHLKDHLRIHSGERPYMCVQCRKTFRISTHLHLHLKIHSNDKSYKCATCGKAFIQSSQLKLHEMIHNPANKTNACDVCGKKFLHIWTLRLHKALHDNKGGKSFVCEQEGCKKKFSVKAYLVRHQKMQHGGVKKQCPICNKYLHAQSMSRHLAIHSGTRTHICELCKKGFYFARNLMIHMRVHTKQKLYTCPVCTKQFSDQSNIRRHYRSVHNMDPWEKKHECNICLKKFYTNAVLQIHMTEVHTTLRQYKCLLCPKTYKNARNLNQHKRSHDESIFFQCPECDQRFSQSGNLKVHISTVHKQIKNHKCDVCSALFSSKRNLQNHMLIHTGQRPYKCSHCEKSFTQRGTLKRHERIHSDERPYSCHICNKGFRQKAHLKLHDSMHFRLVCKICQMPFKTEEQVKDHLISSHFSDKYQCPKCNVIMSEADDFKVHAVTECGLDRDQVDDIFKRVQESKDLNAGDHFSKIQLVETEKDTTPDKQKKLPNKIKSLSNKTNTRQSTRMTDKKTASPKRSNENLMRKSRRSSNQKGHKNDGSITSPIENHIIKNTSMSKVHSPTNNNEHTFKILSDGIEVVITESQAVDSSRQPTNLGPLIDKDISLYEFEDDPHDLPAFSKNLGRSMSNLRRSAVDTQFRADK